MYSHRGAYLNALGEIIHSRHTVDTVYLWTLADVSLQWLVHDLGRDWHRRHACLPAGSRRRRDLAANSCSEGVTHLNAAPDGADHDRINPTPRPNRVAA